MTHMLSSKPIRCILLTLRISMVDHVFNYANADGTICLQTVLEVFGNLTQERIVFWTF